MKRIKRDWAFYVQAFGLLVFWAFALTVGIWFGYRAWWLHGHADAWMPAVAFGIPISSVFLVFAMLLTYLFVRVGATVRPVESDPPIGPIEEAILPSVVGPLSWRYKLTAGILGALAAWGLFCWWYQVRNGLGVTGLSRPVFWGLYIVNFVFFIGISHAGTLISAILRISNAEWRRSITRSAELITVLVLFFGAWNILLDMGRIDRITNVFSDGRLQSPLLWDVCSITTYLTASTLYLYMPLIPDLARLRHRVQGWRRHLYHLLAFGWSDTKEQKHALERVIGIMAVLVVPIAVSVHTVVSWVFSMTVQPMWHSTIFGPYFVVGAIFSGIAALILAMALLRRQFKLQNFLRDIHFNYLGVLLMVMSLLWSYFTLAEYVTVFYGDEPAEMAVFWSKFGGRFAPFFWAMVIACFVIPMAILVRKKTRTVTGTVIASIAVCLGMWLERFTIVVPTLERPRLSYPTAGYVPSWVELSLTVGSFAGFALLYMLATRLMPVVSIWEVEEGREDAPREVAARVSTYFASDPPAASAAPTREGVSS